MTAVALMMCTVPTSAAAATVGNICQEAPCEADPALRVVEYFGADWCEPCRPVEAMLDGLNRSDVLVIRHAPSPQDPGFSNLSYHRFDVHFGLISLPAIVIDGYAVLTGETMTLRLEEALNATNEDRSNLTGNTTTWASPLHAPRGPQALDGNVSSSLPGTANGTWTVTLHDPLPLRPLEAALPAPEASEPVGTEPLSRMELTLVTAVLVLLCAPASVMLWRSMRDDRPKPVDEES
ncbi:MAG: hypothetical protein ACPHK3_02465 [Candidatus Poseidoniaceae archaeon]